MGHTKTVSPLGKFYRWKYSGLIVVPSAVVIILIVWFSYTSSLEFFDYWDCTTLRNYMMDVDVPGNITPHDELSITQHLHLHEIVQECQDFDRFSGPISHPDIT